jgi:hypothetical protein
VRQLRVRHGTDEVTRCGSSHGVEIVFDFMFWPHKTRGWYLEPSLSRTAGTGEKAIGLTAGYLFGWH